jgi:hypothetical protein
MPAKFSPGGIPAAASEDPMKLRTMVLVAAGALTLLSAAPANAYWDRGDWRREQWREREWRRHEWREWHRPYVYAVPPPAYYYAPPRVYYPPPAYYGYP